jgi:hypothetical protein
MTTEALSGEAATVSPLARPFFRTRGIGQFVACALVIAATVILTSSMMFWVRQAGLNPLVTHSEFFAYSWIYGIRWGAGEQVFQPHSQILFALFALINWAFDLSHGSARQILDGWAAVSFWWPMFLMMASLGVLYASMDRAGVVLNAAFSSAVFITAVPTFLEESALFSTSYHSLAIPLALLGLLFWKAYATDAARMMPVRFFALLGFYTAACALGKPTFIAFAAPFFAMEAFKAARARTAASVGKLLLVASVTTIVYSAGLIAFYHQGLGGLLLHLSLSKLFMTSQYHWYDAAKGATPLHWYLGYVIGVMGWRPTSLLVGSLTLASFSRRPDIILVGVAAGFVAALSFLYFRSQLHAHPEFIAAAATATIGAFRCLGFPRHIKVIGFWRLLQPATGAAAMAALFLLYPLHLNGCEILAQQSKFDAPTLDAIFRGSARTLAVENHPEVFAGSADAWCRGGGNIFDNSHSAAVDKLFSRFACANYAQAPRVDLASFNRIVFLQPATSSQDHAVLDLVAAFPKSADRLRNCGSVTVDTPDGSRILQCDLTPG